MLPAGAIHKGDTVRLDAGTDTSVEVKVAKVEHSTPIAGRITWTDGKGKTYELGAAVRVEVVKL